MKISNNYYGLFMQNIVRLKASVLALGLSVMATSASAQLVADKNDINSTSGKASVSVTFPAPMNGDLYLATVIDKQVVIDKQMVINKQIMFFADNGTKFSTDVAPFVANGNFSTPMHVLDVASDGIPPGIYSLYQVVVKPNTPRNLDGLLSNIIGDGLSEIKFNINLNGAELYKELTCASSSCHGSDPSDSRTNRGVLKGTTLANLKAAIKKSPVEMGFLSTTSDAKLQAVADYLRTFF